MLNRITPELVAEALREDIAAGRIPPGDALRQADLAMRFGVSRIPVREALRQLEAEDLVVVRANRGAFVRCFTPDELREIFDLRVLLETDLMRRSVERMTRTDLQRIRHHFSASKGAAPTELRAADRRFHEALYEPASRPMQLAMALKLRDSIAHYAPADEHMRRLKADWVDDHRQILEACELQDATDAVRVLTHHLTVAGELTIGNVRRDPTRTNADETSLTSPPTAG